MDPVSTATLANVVPASARVGNAAPVTPASAAILANAALANPLVASTQVDISPLGQYLSGVALSRRQLLALQGLDDEVATPANPALAASDALVALARQLSDSFAQLRASGVDAGQLAMTDGSQDDLAQRFALLSGQVAPGASEALAQNTDALTQADLARIGIDLQNNRPVDVAALQAAFEADRAGTLNILQQGTDVLAEVGAALTLRQGAPANSDTTDFDAATVTQAAQPDQPAQAPVLAQQQALTQHPELAQQQALAQRQLEVQQQLETEDLTQGLQELRQQQQLQQHSTLQAAQQLQQNQQVQLGNPPAQAQQLDGEQGHLQTGRIEREAAAAQTVAQEHAQQQQDAAQVEGERVEEVRAGQTRQAQLQQQVQEAKDEAARAQLAASEAQRAALAATERAQTVAREAQVQLDAGFATTAQALQAQQNAQAQQQAALNAALAVQQPSSQDPAVAAAIAAYNINNSALNPGLMNRPPPASDAQRPAVAPVTRVTAATPLKELKPGV
ncbi:hypothetical protein [Janthinobacterium sp. PC23-8]|uniref:hypothetical protein n=1 Tax=Janthinobacterium sp. PC23-8 TaxID=2012679 RepID=UPI000B96E4B2|nr:hypothetical protein [Janthinobacterium sp. PC23-8]OYO25721.1 hypothetical protein CD932_26845 [Janthinobacterium sp. PC23-8]